MPRPPAEPYPEAAAEPYPEAAAEPYPEAAAEPYADSSHGYPEFEGEAGDAGVVHYADAPEPAADPGAYEPVDPASYGHDYDDADDGDYDEADEVTFFNYSGGTDEPAGTDAPAGTDEPVGTDEPHASAEPVYAAEAHDAGHDEALTTEMPVYEYEEPPPFTDDYTLEAQPPVPASGHAAAADPSYSMPDAHREPVRHDDLDEDVHAVLSDGAREIAGEVRNSLDFQRIQGGGEAVQGVVLSGPVLDVPGFADALERELGLPVYRGEVDWPSGGNGTTLAASRLAVAAGLSVEEIAP